MHSKDDSFVKLDVKSTGYKNARTPGVRRGRKLASKRFKNLGRHQKKSELL